MANRSRSSAQRGPETWRRSRKYRGNWHAGSEGSFSLTRKARVRVMARLGNTRTTRTGAIWCFSTNTFTAKPAAAAARAIKLAGRLSRENYWRTKLNTPTEARSVETRKATRRSGNRNEIAREPHDQVVSIRL